MTITTYPDGHSVQQGTPEELAQFIFAATEVQTLQKFKSLVEAIRRKWRNKGILW